MFRVISQELASPYSILDHGAWGMMKNDGTSLVMRKLMKLEESMEASDTCDMDQSSTILTPLHLITGSDISSNKKKSAIPLGILIFIRGVYHLP